MSKPFLENMSKEERQAFSYLEKMIVQAKVECIQAIPKTQNYDFSNLENKMQLLESKIDKYMIEMAALRNAHKNIMAETKLLDYYIELFDDLTSLNAFIIKNMGIGNAESNFKMEKIIVLVKKIKNTANLQNDTYKKHIKFGGVLKEKYKEDEQIL